MTPTISVILPVYNGGRHLEEAVRSVLAQTFRDFEAIVINDGSRDNSLDILQRLAAEDDRIRLISRENRGFVPTLNEALSLARGRYIARMDQDDVCDPERFERQLQRLEAEPDLVAVGSRVIAIDPENRVLGLERMPLKHEHIDELHLCGHSGICHPAVMMRADVLRKIGGYRDVSPVDDYDLWLRLAEVGRLANIQQPLLKYRRSTTGMVATYAPKRMAMLEQVMRDVWRRRGLPGEPRVPRRHLYSHADIYRQWSWWALDEGFAQTARAYAWKALKAQPFSPRSWWLALCAVRGREHVREPALVEAGS